jgi:hypothetical protein
VVLTAASFGRWYGASIIEFGSKIGVTLVD